MADCNGLGRLYLVLELTWLLKYLPLAKNLAGQIRKVRNMYLR